MGPFGTDGLITYLPHIKNPGDNGDQGDNGMPGK